VILAWSVVSVGMWQGIQVSSSFIIEYTLVNICSSCLFFVVFFVSFGIMLRHMSSSSMYSTVNLMKIWMHLCSVVKQFEV